MVSSWAFVLPEFSRRVLTAATRAVSIAIIWLSLFSSPVFASEDFTLSFSSTYAVSQDYQSMVTHRVLMTNKKPNTYASEYSIAIGSTSIALVEAFDQRGSLPISITKAANSTTITVNLAARPSVGRGKTKDFTIQYQNGDIAAHVGNILEINIPKLANANEFDEYRTTLLVPEELGSASSIIPEPVNSVSNNDQQVFSFENHKDSGITAVFGSSQIYALKLSYYLTNGSFEEKVQVITLVPDTAYQRVDYQDLSPRPQSVSRDEDGNWLASYRLEPRESIQVTASVAVEVFMTPTIDVPDNDPLNYLGPSEYWPVDDPQLVELARSLGTAQAMYQYVTNNLDYDYQRAESGSGRLGAKAALLTPSKAICTEFTDLFITLARAAGIPARELNGFAYTQNPKLRPLSLSKDILHAWPEYWDKEKQEWIQIDPTWGNTTGGIDYFRKLDFNHIVFAIHGLSPTDPLPAGFFKTTSAPGKTVLVEPKTDRIAGRDTLQVESSIPRVLPTYLISEAVIRVENVGSRAVYRVPVAVSMPYQLVTSPESEIASILPWQQVSLPIAIKPRSLWEQQRNPATITIGDITNSYDTITAPPITGQQAGAIALAFVIILVVALAVKAWHLRLSRQQTDSDLRRDVQKPQSSG